MFRNKLVFLTVIVLSLFLSSCVTNYQPPTDSENTARTAIFDDGSILNYGPDAGQLQTRDGNLGDQYYNGREMLLGVMDPVYFGFDSNFIEESQRKTLQKAAEYLLDNPDLDLLVKGMCDWYGTEEYNLALGDLRANSVANYLEDLGIDPIRINTVSTGSLEAQIGLSKTNSRKDRRADLILLK
jgi:peptidoglycan-associated lipoprotein